MEFKKEYIRLEAGGGQAWVDPAEGMNLVRLYMHGHEWIHEDETRKNEKKTYGVPVLYPTPNRIENGRFTFMGKEYAADMHGFVRFMPFEITQQGQTEEGAFVTGRLVFAKGTPAYEKFPWESVLQLTIRLDEKGAHWEYKVENRDEKPLPYSFALHPLFIWEKGVSIKVDADLLMEKTEEKLPTGRLLPLDGRAEDLRKKKETAETDLDDIYVKSPCHAEIEYPARGRRLVINASDEFKCMVVFTPQGQPFYCAEPQTGLTNCHNLANAGLADAANLLVVPPGKTAEGWTEFLVD